MVFGLGPFSQLVSYYLRTFTHWHVACYTVDGAYVTSETFEGRPVVAFDELADRFAPDEHDAVIAVGYRRMGDIRKAAFRRMAELGYAMPNFVHPSSSVMAAGLGEANIVLEQVSLGPGSVLGDANVVWGGVQVGHGCRVGSCCTMCMGAVFGGNARIGDNCFFGLNSTVTNSCAVAPYTMLGAQGYLTHPTREREAYLSDVSAKRHRTRDSFEMMAHWAG